LTDFLLKYGMGPRTCQGKNIALMVLFKVIPQLVRNFDFELQGDWRTENRWLVKQTDFKCKISLRSSPTE
jgi:cytochrome P450